MNEQSNPGTVPVAMDLQEIGFKKYNRAYRPLENQEPKLCVVL